MKKLLSVVVCLIIGLHVYPQNPTDKTRIFLAGKMTIDNPILVKANSGSHYFIMSDSIFTDCKGRPEHLIDNPFAYLFLLSDRKKEFLKELNLNLAEYKLYEENPSIERLSGRISHFNFVYKVTTPPPLYLLVLIRGDVYNRLAVKEGDKPLKMKYPYAFYKLAIPCRSSLQP